MKRFNSSDSLGALVSPDCPPKEIDKGYSKEFQAMLDSLAQEDCNEELGLGKKRRLSSEQVKALERYFDVENKLEPERKAKLADELGLQPRQVAIWFQNRRARWKTKQLEKDYGLLKANYNSLKLSFDDLRQQNEALAQQVRELKVKVCRGESDEESIESVKEESPPNNDGLDHRKDHNDIDSDEIMIKPGNIEQYGHPKSSLFLIDASSSSERGQMGDGNLKFSLALKGSSSSTSSSSSSNALMANWAFQLSDSSRALPVNNNMSALFGSEEPSCNNFFSVDQAPTLYWYFPDQQ